MYIKILSIDGSNLWNYLEDFQGLTFESSNPGGHSIAGFSFGRDVTQQYSDSDSFNQIIIGEGPQEFWQGYVDYATRSISPDTYDFSCLGWGARLNECGTTADITAGGGGYLMSTFITAVMLADANVSPFITAGTIEVGDYAYPNGTRFEFAPYTPYADALENLNQGNNYDHGTWGTEFDFTAKTPTVIDWLVSTNDCTDITISPNPDALCNYVICNYSADYGRHYQQVVSQDAASQAKYGRVIVHYISIPGSIPTAGATQIANQYIADHKDLKVKAEFTCKRVFDTSYVEHHLGEVRAGQNVKILDWLPTMETVVGVSDIATFQIRSTSYNHDDYTLRVTPTEPVSQIEVDLARLQTVGYLR